MRHGSGSRFGLLFLCALLIGLLLVPAAWAEKDKGGTPRKKKRPGKKVTQPVSPKPVDTISPETQATGSSGDGTTPTPIPGSPSDPAGSGPSSPPGTGPGTRTGQADTTHAEEPGENGESAGSGTSETSGAAGESGSGEPDGTEPAADSEAPSQPVTPSPAEEVDPEAPRPPGTPGTVAVTEPVFNLPGRVTPPTSPTSPQGPTGSVFVNCPTLGARLRIDGILKGGVNETVPVGPEGIYDIEVFAPGYLTHKVQRKIPAGQTLSFDVLLQPLPGTPAPGAAAPTPAPTPTPAPDAGPAAQPPAEKGVAGAWRVDFKGSTKAILRKNSIVEIQQNGSSVTMIADTYLPNRNMLSSQEWELKEKFRWSGTFRDGRLSLKSWKGLLQFEATLGPDGRFLEGKVNSSANRYHTYVTLRKL